MAAYNSASTIGEAIESVRLQTRSDWELLVVDDGSRDGTGAVVEAFADPRIQLVRESENRGPAATRNRGISLAEAPLVCILDSDDLWLPKYLETMARALDADADAAVACTDAWVLDKSTGRVRKTSVVEPQNPPQPLPDDRQTFLAELLRRNFIYNSITARRELVLAAGGYDERLRVGEDWELWLRLVAGGFRFVRVPELLAVYRTGAESLTSDPERLMGASNEVYRIVAEEWSAGDEVRNLALGLLRETELDIRRRALAAPLLGPLIKLRNRFRESRLWRDEPPPEVADLLRSVTTPPR